MSKLLPNQIVADMIRMEVKSSTGELYLIFEVTDPLFKQEMLKDWTQDFELKVTGTKLLYIRKG
jgi:hypothetical protein